MTNSAAMNILVIVLCLVTQSCWLFVTPWTVARQAPLSVRILQAGTLEWVAMPSSRESSQPKDRTQVSHIADRFFAIWATREAVNTGVGSLSLLQGIFSLGIELGSPALQADSLPAELQGKPHSHILVK